MISYPLEHTPGMNEPDPLPGPSPSKIRNLFIMSIPLSCQSICLCPSAFIRVHPRFLLPLCDLRAFARGHPPLSALRALGGFSLPKIRNRESPHLGLFHNSQFRRISFSFKALSPTPSLPKGPKRPTFSPSRIFTFSQAPSSVPFVSFVVSPFSSSPFIRVHLRFPPPLHDFLAVSSHCDVQSRGVVLASLACSPALLLASGRLRYIQNIRVHLDFMLTVSVWKTGSFRRSCTQRPTRGKYE